MREKVETTEYLAMLARMIRAAGRRVGDADEVELAQLAALRDDLDTAIRTAVRLQRGLHKRSWTEIAKGLGTTRQAAQQRFGEGVGHE